jgi:hypothetical protein
MILVGRHRAFNDGLLRTSLTTWDARVHRPKLEVVQQRTSCEDTKAEPIVIGSRSNIVTALMRRKNVGRAPLMQQ